MTVASEITRIKNNITKAYNSAKVRGAIAPAVQNSDNLASCIDTIVTSGGSGSGDGDKIFVKNLTGKEIEAGEKVLVNFTTDVGNILGNNISSYYKPFGFVLKDGRGVFITNHNKERVLCSERNGEIVYSKITANSTIDARAWYVFTDTHLVYKIVNSNNIIKEELTTGIATISQEYAINDKLFYDTATGVIYNLDKSLSYDTGIITGTALDVALYVYNNLIVISKTTETTIIDTTDFPNCTKRIIKINSPVNLQQNMGITGVEDGDYFVATEEKTCRIFQLVGNTYKQVYTVGLPYPNTNNYGKSSVFMNHAEKVLCLFDENLDPRLYFLDKTLKEVAIPQETFLDICKNSKDLNALQSMFAMNRDMTGFVVMPSNTNSSKNNTYGYISKGLEIAVKDNIYLNYNPEESYTGFATGEVDENGNVEVSLTLADKVDVTVVTDVDVADNEITFEGLI